MSDMSQVIVAKSDQINAGDLVGISRTVRVASVNVQPGTEQPVAVKIEGDNKVYRPCKSMSRVLVAAWGPDSAKYAGRSMTLYCDPDVLWAGMKVGGIRISHMSHIDSPITLALAENKKNRKLFTVKPLQQRTATPAAATSPAAAANAPPTDAGRLPTGAAFNEDVAKGWTDACLNAIGDASDRDAVLELEERAKVKLKNRADLLPLVTAAVSAKLAFLDGLNGSTPADDGFGEGDA